MTAGLAPEISRHKCLIYDGHPSEQLPVVVPLLLDGLKDNFRCLYLGSPDVIALVQSALAERGIAIEQEQQRGALVFSSDRSYLAGGRFDPDAMVRTLRSAIDEAVRDGFDGLCASGDMRWELGANDDNFDAILEYEAQLEQVFRDKPLRGICQYHRATVPIKSVRDALLTHRSTYIGSELNRDNLFYIPPEVLLEAREGTDRAGEWMCQQILRVMKAERSRDEALLALEVANKELERRVTERTAELEVANKHLEAFAYSVSHDLRAPLRAIGGFSGIVAKDYAHLLPPEGVKHLGRVTDGVKQMQELVDGMLALSRVMRTDMSPGPVDLTALASDVLREIQEREPRRPADFVIRPGLNAIGDRVLIRVALTNLLDNAWKFTARLPRAVIEVGHRTVGERHAFFVRDNGAGFDVTAAKRLFTPFQRLHDERDYPGTGVGLATVQRVIERHGGTVWAESSPGQGATFFFTLPGLG